MPDIGPGVFVPGCNPGADRDHELFHRAVGAAREPFGGELAEPALDQVHPGAVGGREVKDEAGMGKQPVLDSRGLMRGGVVHYHVHRQVGRHLPVNRAQKLDELGGPVPGGKISDYLPGLDDATVTLNPQLTNFNLDSARMRTRKTTKNGVPESQRYVVTLKKSYMLDSVNHDSFARITFDQKGEMIKLSASR